MGSGAAEIIAADGAEGAAAAAAEDFSGQHMPRPAAGPEPGRQDVGAGGGANGAEPLGGLVPGFLVDDAQVRHRLDNPFRARVRARHSFPGGRVFEEAHAVPHQPADIEFIAQKPGAAPGMAADGGIPPGAPLGAGHSLGVQPFGDGNRAGAAGEEREDAAHDGRLGFIDAAPAALRFAIGVELADHIIAIAEPARRAPGGDPPAQAAPCLVGEVLEKEGVHRALEADMEFGNLPLGQGNKADAGEFEALEESGDVFLVAREPVEGFGDDDVEGGLARAFEQRLITRAHRRGAAERGIAIDLHQFPTLANDALLAKTQLVFDGGIALGVGGIAGIDDSAEGHGRGSSGDAFQDAAPSWRWSRPTRRLRAEWRGMAVSVPCDGAREAGTPLSAAI